MNILELSVQADAEGAEAVAALFNEHAYGGAVIEQTITPEPGQYFDPVHPYTVRAFLLEDESLQQKRQTLEEGIWRLSLLRPLGAVNSRELAEQDYANEWKKFYSILHIGKHIIIKPSWLEYESRTDDVIIELDPGMAFGTGLHPTTRLCLAALENYVGPGATVLDVGTGSGVLAIGGAKLGARLVDARDIDPIAAETSAKNVAINHVSEVVTVSRGSVTIDEPRLAFNVIIANIFADTIAELMPALTVQLAPDGVMILSGILADNSLIVEDALARSGLRLMEQEQEEDWLVMVAAF